VKQTSFAIALLLTFASFAAAEEPPAATDHGKTVALGSVTVAEHEFSVLRLGEIVPGKEGAFEVTLVKGPAGADLQKLNVFGWVEQEDGKAASAAGKGSLENGKFHIHVNVRPDASAPKRFVLRLRTGTIDERATLPLEGKVQEHVGTPHDGMVAAFQGPDGKGAGHLELKLHDDKGDLELWLAKDAKFTEPWDLPLDTVIRVEFLDVQGKSVTLRVRNKDKNEDEDGTATIRAGKTNYFIFPGDSGQDPAWLMGANFTSRVRVTWSADSKAFTSQEFVLVPHTHAGGHGHGHGHDHATPHDGIVASFKGPDGKVAGHLELKLHDDKGDLELWIAKDAKITQPMDLALDTVIRVTFLDVAGKTVELRVRNKDKNEDEGGTATVRAGKTNYFIFPGESGQDAAWLMGAKFQSVVRVTFNAGETACTSEEFMLVPHTHADGSTHK
jgi:hypothetical protein